jgi:hypothetical protein
MPAAAAAASGPAARKPLSDATRELWIKITDFARTEATQKITAKNKKFAGLRKFAEIAAKRKRELARKKAEEDAAEDAMMKAAHEAASRPKQSLLALLDVPLPSVEKKDIEEYAGA